MITVDKRKRAKGTGEVCADVPDYKELTINMLREIDESDNRFLIQVYTIVHRHMKKRGR
ncbi:MAG: hypothetical protein K1W13_03055 [Lachnospiraceae bacterium]